MIRSLIHNELLQRGARFFEDGVCEIVKDFGDFEREYEALMKSCCLVDLSTRGRICIAGKDRKRFLHGQVTNDINKLRVGDGCYTAVVTAKGKMASDANVFCLEDELLVDVEPGYLAPIIARLEKYIIADEVEIVDVSSSYGQLHVAGPEVLTVIREAGVDFDCETTLEIRKISKLPWGESYAARVMRFGVEGVDLFVPSEYFALAFSSVLTSVEKLGGRICGGTACERSRIEAGIPRFGVDMDETNLPPEAGIEDRAVSYTKGCYIGQEVIARIKTYGQVAKKMHRLDFGESFNRPERGKGDLFVADRNVGHVTSVTFSPRAGRWLGLGYVRKEVESGGSMEVRRVEDHALLGVARFADA